ncbi:MAG: response regulator [Gluconacetobacter diazotrophicus]|nr:response regulator [Gluconacetobacter diazotrophicus]
MTVLLVEDEPITRDNLAQQLEWAGLKLVTATSGKTAMEELRRRGSHFDALVTDLHLGDGIDGAQVAEEMERGYPRARIIIMTGRFDLLDMRWQERGWILIPKPFAAARLVAALRAERPA